MPYTWGVHQLFPGGRAQLLLWAGSRAEHVKITNKMVYLGHITMWQVWVGHPRIKFLTYPNYIILYILMKKNMSFSYQSKSTSVPQSEHQFTVSTLRVNTHVILKLIPTLTMLLTIHNCDRADINHTECHCTTGFTRRHT